MLSFINIPYMNQKERGNLNTSHVIFYLEIHFSLQSKGGFKYISCYLLSGKESWNEWQEWVFKYISCYLLSHQFF